MPLKSQQTPLLNAKQLLKKLGPAEYAKCLSRSLQNDDASTVSPAEWCTVLKAFGGDHPMLRSFVTQFLENSFLKEGKELNDRGLLKGIRLASFLEIIPSQLADELVEKYSGYAPEEKLRHFMQQGNYQAALRASEQLTPKDAEIWRFAIAHCHYELGKPLPLFKLIKSEVARNSDDAYNFVMAIAEPPLDRERNSTNFRQLITHLPPFFLMLYLKGRGNALTSWERDVFYSALQKKLIKRAVPTNRRLEFVRSALYSFAAAWEKDSRNLCNRLADFQTAWLPLLAMFGEKRILKVVGEVLEFPKIERCYELLQKKRLSLKDHLELMDFGQNFPVFRKAVAEAIEVLFLDREGLVPIQGYANFQNLQQGHFLYLFPRVPNSLAPLAYYMEHDGTHPAYDDPEQSGISGLTFMSCYYARTAALSFVVQGNTVLAKKWIKNLPEHVFYYKTGRKEGFISDTVNFAEKLMKLPN